MTPLDDLRALVPPPAEPEPAGEPARPVPRDYADLVATYGPGQFDEFIWLLAPGIDDPYLDLERQAEVRLGALETMGDENPYGAALLPFAFTDNGDVAFWHTVGDPEDWRVVANESRGPEWYEFHGTATEFLLATLKGTERVPFFPEDFPDPEPGFTPAA